MPSCGGARNGANKNQLPAEAQISSAVGGLGTGSLALPGWLDDPPGRHMSTAASAAGRLWGLVQAHRPHLLSAAVGAVVVLLMGWLAGLLRRATGVAEAGRQRMSSVAADESCKLVILVRTDLNMVTRGLGTEQYQCHWVG